MFLFITYQVLEVHKEEALLKIAKLEVEVFGLQEQLENEKRFDLALTTGAGRGRPKSGAFVSYVRCLLGTGLLSPLILLSPYTSLSVPITSSYLILLLLWHRMFC